MTTLLVFISFDLAQERIQLMVTAKEEAPHSLQARGVLE